MRNKRIRDRVREHFELEEDQMSRRQFFKEWIKYYTFRIPPFLFFTVVSIYFLATITLIEPTTSFGYAHAGDEREVVISDEQREFVSSRYDSELENAFCVYGETTDDRIIVKEVDKAVIYSRTKGSVSFSCISHMIGKMDELILNTDNKLIGDIHTHPPRSPASMSRVDVAGISLKTPFFYPVRGVYSEGDLNFFTIESLNSGLGQYSNGY